MTFDEQETQSFLTTFAHRMKSLFKEVKNRKVNLDPRFKEASWAKLFEPLPDILRKEGAKQFRKMSHHIPVDDYEGKIMELASKLWACKGLWDDVSRDIPGDQIWSFNGKLCSSTLLDAYFWGPFNPQTAAREEEMARPDRPTARSGLVLQLGSSEVPFGPREIFFGYRQLPFGPREVPFGYRQVQCSPRTTSVTSNEQVPVVRNPDFVIPSIFNIPQPQEQGPSQPVFNNILQPREPGPSQPVVNPNQPTPMSHWVFDYAPTNLAMFTESHLFAIFRNHNVSTENKAIVKNELVRRGWFLAGRQTTWVRRIPGNRYTISLCRKMEFGQYEFFSTASMTNWKDSRWIIYGDFEMPSPDIFPVVLFPNMHLN